MTADLLIDNGKDGTKGDLVGVLWFPERNSSAEK